VSVTPETSSSQLSRQPLQPRWMIFSVALLGLLGLSLWLRLAAPSNPEPPRVAARPTSLAVLPFLNPNPDSADNYLGYGVAAELTQALRRLPGLRVAPHSSAFPLGRTNQEPSILGRRLGVGTVLQGSVLRSRDRLRVTAHLVDVDQGFDLWSETYDRAPADLLTIQDEIAQAVADALRLRRPGSAAGAPALTASVPAYDAYLAGRYLLDQQTPESARRAVSYFTWALHLDTTFVRAQSALADAHLRRGGVDGVAPRVSIPLALAAANRARALDSMLPDPHVLLGTIRFLYDRNWKLAEKEFRRAIELEPGVADLYPPYARFLLALGRNDEARDAIDRALRLSPLAPRLLEQLGWYHLYTREYSRAREALWRAIALDSAAWRPRLHLAFVEQALGNYPQAIAHLQGPLQRSVEQTELPAALGQVYAAAGRADEAQAILVRLLESARQRYVSPYIIATLQASLGQRRQAFASLDQAVREHSELIPFLRIDPRVDSLRPDPRFGRLLRRLRLP
jgi:TolB-like protein/Tfp pilus assembly protein PilF